jgi:glycolate oxidase FAD binding subunit
MTTAANVGVRLESLLGADRVTGAAEDLQDFAIAGLLPSAVVRPASAEEVTQVVQFALKENLSLIPCGSRSKLEIGAPPSRYDVAVDTTSLQSIAHYDAGDLTLAVDAGLPLRRLTEILAEKNQFLPLAVPCFESCTVAGVVASGIDSSLRLQYGTARDFLIGAEFVDGAGKLCKSGGRVVKNVTGYDLHKLLVGSLGTLGIITRLNFRTFPLPESSRGHLASFASVEDALSYCKIVNAAGLPLANVELLSPEVASIIAAILKRTDLSLSHFAESDKWYVYVAFEGHESVLRRIAEELEKHAREGRAQTHELLEQTADETLGGMLREAYEWLRWSAPQVALVRIVVPTALANDLAEFARIAQTNSLQHALLVRAEGVLYLALMASNSDEAALAALRNAVRDIFLAAREKKGHAKLLHAPVTITAFAAEPAPHGLALSVEKRVRQAFDPHNIFAPGRIVGAA